MHPSFLLLGALLCAPALAGAAPAVVEVSNFDANHSTVGFSVPILGGLSEVEGKFADFTILLRYDQDNVTRSSVEATIRAASIDTGISERDQDLRGSGFFDVAHFPEIVFKSSAVEKRGDVLLVRGALSMHGMSRPMELPLRVQLRQEQGGLLFSISGDVELNRDDWGISWRHPKDDFVGNKVKVRLRVLSKLVRKSPEEHP